MAVLPVSLQNSADKQKSPEQNNRLHLHSDTRDNDVATVILAGSSGLQAGNESFMR